MSAYEGCRDLTRPPVSAAALAGPQRFGLRLRRVARPAQCLKVSARCGASLSLWDDVVNRLKRRGFTLALALLAQVTVTRGDCITNATPCAATAATACPASRPCFGLVCMLVAVAVGVARGAAAQLVAAGCWCTCWHQSLGSK